MKFLQNDIELLFDRCLLLDRCLDVSTCEARGGVPDNCEAAHTVSGSRLDYVDR